MNNKIERIKTIKEQVYEILKNDILKGIYQPGERLQELVIAKKLNVSRSPVREALKELIGEGLLVSIPNKSITVKELSEKEIIDIFDFRYITEKYSIEKTIENIDEKIITKLLKMKTDLITHYKRNNLHEYCKTDSEFHRFLIKSSGNLVLSDVVGNVMAMIEQFRVISLSSSRRFEESLDEHVKMIDFIINRDSETAWEHCRRHLDCARNEIIEYLRNKK